MLPAKQWKGCKVPLLGSVSYVFDYLQVAAPTISILLVLRITPVLSGAPPFSISRAIWSDLQHLSCLHLECCVRFDAQWCSIEILANLSQHLMPTPSGSGKISLYNHYDVIMVQFVLKFVCETWTRMTASRSKMQQLMHFRFQWELNLNSGWKKWVIWITLVAGMQSYLPLS